MNLAINPKPKKSLRMLSCKMVHSQLKKVILFHVKRQAFFIQFAFYGLYQATCLNNNIFFTIPTGIPRARATLGPLAARHAPRDAPPARIDESP